LNTRPRELEQPMRVSSRSWTKNTTMYSILYLENDSRRCRKTCIDCIKRNNVIKDIKEQCGSDDHQCRCQKSSKENCWWG
jgi:hypothetical protein